MTSDELKKAVSAILGQEHSTQLYFILKVNENFILRLADLEDANTAQEIQSMFEKFLDDNVISNDEMTVCNLSIADESQNYIYEYDYDTYPDELNLFKQFNIEKAVNLDHFNFTTDDLSNLFGYIIYIGSMNNGITLLKKHYPIFLIKRDSFLLGLAKSRKRFIKLDEEDIIRLNNDAQILRVGDTTFVLNLKILEHNLGFSALIRRAANESVDAIEKLEIVDDIEELRDMLEVPSFERKLSKVKQASPIFRLGISKESIIEFTKITPSLKGKFKYSEDGTQIRLGTKKSKIAFLKLMNDAFLHSELTQQWYDASAKLNITQES